MAVNRKHGAIVGVVVAVAVSSGLLLRPDEHQKMLKSVEKLNVGLPRPVDSVTTQTAVALDGQVVTYHYAVKPPIEIDGAIIIALEQSVRRQACAKPEVREFLARGYSVDNVYAVTTAHGPDHMHVLVKPDDCH